MSLAARRRLVVLLGGAGGSALRIAVEDGFDAGASEWPWGTLLVNLAGALLLGYVVTRSMSAARPGPLLLPLVGIGFLGALTTFSTFSLEVYLLGDADRVGMSVAYAAVTIGLGLAAAISGSALAGRRS